MISRARALAFNSRFGAGFPFWGNAQGPAAPARETVPPERTASGGPGTPPCRIRSTPDGAIGRPTRPGSSPFLSSTPVVPPSPPVRSHSRGVSSSRWVGYTDLFSSFQWLPTPFHPPRPPFFPIASLRHLLAPMAVVVWCHRRRMHGGRPAGRPDRRAIGPHGAMASHLISISAPYRA